MTLFRGHTVSNVWNQCRSTAVVSMSGRIPVPIPALVPLLIFVLACTAAWAGEKPPRKVLFIGNSQMAYYGLPQMIEGMSQSAPAERPRIQAGDAIRGGTSLKAHWEAGTTPDTPRGMITTQQWDDVVIQEIFTHAANTPGARQFEEYATRFDEAIKGSGARTIIFATAGVTEYYDSSHRYPDSFKALNDMQIAFARKAGVPVAAAGYAWMRYLGPDPTLEQRLDLYAEDKGHPGGKGTYIYACLLYAVITGFSPEGLRCEFANIRGGVSIPGEEAAKMQKAAWEQYQANPPPSPPSQRTR